MISKTMNIKEFSDYTGIPLTTCYQLVKRDDFPSRKIGKSWKILRSEVDKWLLDYFTEDEDNL